MKKEFFEALERKVDGRYIVRLPWKKGHPLLPTNKEIAEKRLQSATRKLLAAEHFEL